MQGKLTALGKHLDQDSLHAYEHIFHIKEVGSSHAGAIESYILPDIVNSMPITAVCLSAINLSTAQRDGAASSILRMFALPDVRQVLSAKLAHCVRQMWINCDSSCLAAVDAEV
jgi:hypothetical protein